MSVRKHKQRKASGKIVSSVYSFSYLIIYFCISNNPQRVMFKRTWKQIKILIVMIIILVCLPRSVLPHLTDDTGKDDLVNYQKLNESEKRLIEFKDDDESLKLKIAQLDIINKSRNKNRSEEHTSELQSRQYLVCRLRLV